MTELPYFGFLRIKQILGDPRANPPVPAIIPVSKSTWWLGVSNGRFPRPTRALGDGITAWDVRDIRALVEAAQPDKYSSGVGVKTSGGGDKKLRIGDS